MRRVLVVLVVLGLLAGIGVWVYQQRDQLPVPRPRTGCHVSTGGEASDGGASHGGEVELDTDQMAHAATITAVGVRLGMPDRAVMVALATALQESKLRNLPHLGPGNDHDSVGLFQQRPSQGWGSEEQISDPRYAAEQFYQALRRVAGWQQLRVTEAAQRVQRSAFPEAYAQWAGDAGALTTALLGHEPGTVSCAVLDDPDLRGPAATDALAETLATDWGGQVETARTDPDGLALRAVDRATGWRYAHWLVSHAAGHGVARVQFADLTWRADDGGWVRVEDTTERVVAEVTPEQ